MPRKSGQVIQNNFSNGLVTEATGLNFPENSAIETWDCVFDKKGRITRRFGFEYENQFTLQDQESTTGVKAEYVWKSAGSNGITTFVVLQEGHVLSFFAPDLQGRISPTKKSFTVNLTTYATTGSTTTQIAERRADLASGNGKLFVQHSLCEPIYVAYDEDTDAITVTEYELEVRDMGGIVDETSPGQRPASVSDKHRYNLRNQGWYISVQCGTGKNTLEDLGIQNVLEFWGIYKPTELPSNSDVWWLYKDAEDRFNNKQFDTIAVGNSPAPKGHYIDNAFRFDRSALSNVPGLDVKTSGTTRPSCVAFFAGRIWYSGVNIDDYVGKLYYTQVIEGEENIGKCYQRNDPTDENLSDLLDTDGGVVDLLEAANIVKLVPLQNALFVFAENGIWVVTGSQGTGFVATDYTVSKISEVPCLSGYNFITVDGYPMWWNNEAIYALSPENNAFTAKNITEEKIKDFYQSIIADNLVYAKGAYSATSKRIQWLYRSTAANAFEDNFVYDRVLVLDLASGAFYPWKISIGAPKVRGVVALDSVGAFIDIDEVTVDGDPVEVNTDPVTVEILVTGSEALPLFNYLTTGTLLTLTNKLVFSRTTNASFIDWTEDAPVSYDSTLLTGPMVHAEGNKDFAIEYATFFSDNADNSGFLVQVRWDWSDDGASGQWSGYQQGYNSGRFHRTVQRRRLLIRGSGPSLQFYIKSQDNKPFSILGWSTWESADDRA